MRDIEITVEKKKKGEVKLDVKFDIDESGILNVKVQKEDKDVFSGTMDQYENRRDLEAE